MTPRARPREASMWSGFIFASAATSGSPGGRADIGLGVLEDGDAGQLLAFQVLERRSAAGRNVREATAQTERVDRGHGVSAADQRVRARRRDRLADRLRPVGEV